MRTEDEDIEPTPSTTVAGGGLGLLPARRFLTVGGLHLWPLTLSSYHEST